MRIISKGRTSSDQLLSMLRQIRVTCFGFGILPVLVHVESSSLAYGAAVKGLTCMGVSHKSHETEERYYEAVRKV